MTHALADIADLDARYISVANMEACREEAFVTWRIEFVRRGRAWFQPADRDAAVNHLFDVAEQLFVSEPFCRSASEIADSYIEAMTAGIHHD